MLLGSGTEFCSALGLGLTLHDSDVDPPAFHRVLLVAFRCVALYLTAAMGLGLTVHRSALGLGLTVRYSN